MTTCSTSWARLSRLGRVLGAACLSLSIFVAVAPASEAGEPLRKVAAKKGKGKASGKSPKRRNLDKEIEKGVGGRLQRKRSTTSSPPPSPSTSASTATTQQLTAPPASSAAPKQDATAGGANPSSEPGKDGEAPSGPGEVPMPEGAAEEVGIDPAHDASSAETGEAEHGLEDHEGVSGARSPSATSSTSPGTEDDVVEDEEPDPPAFGRVAPGVFELDVLTAGAVRGWVPQQYPAMDVSTTVLATWQIDVRANVANLFRIRRAYYESSGLVAPRGQVSGVAEDAANAVSKMAWLLGVIGVPIGKTFEPIVRYEARAFESTATPTQPVRFIPYDADASVDLHPSKPGSPEQRPSRRMPIRTIRNAAARRGAPQRGRRLRGRQHQ